MSMGWELVTRGFCEPSSFALDYLDYIICAIAHGIPLHQAVYWDGKRVIFFRRSPVFFFEMETTASN